MIASHGNGHGDGFEFAEGSLEILVLAIIIALIVWIAGQALRRPDIGNPAAAVVVVIGALLALLAAV